MQVGASARRSLGAVVGLAAIAVFAAACLLLDDLKVNAKGTGGATTQTTSGTGASSATSTNTAHGSTSGTQASGTQGSTTKASSTNTTGTAGMCTQSTGTTPNCPDTPCDAADDCACPQCENYSLCAPNGGKTCTPGVCAFGNDSCKCPCCAQFCPTTSGG